MSKVPTEHAVRQFNRFYTRRIGVLAPYLGSDMSLTDVRVLYELAHRDAPTASEIARDLALDHGYLSRILRRFEGGGWLTRTPSPRDARQSLLALTDAGRAAFAPLEQKSHDEAAALLDPLSAPQREQLVQAMTSMQQLLEPAARRGNAAAPTRTALLRDPVPGDIGWVVQQHGELYWREYGWNNEFEALVAELPPSSSASSSRSGKSAGSPNSTANASAPPSWCANRQRSRSCACCC